MKRIYPVFSDGWRSVGVAGVLLLAMASASAKQTGDSVKYNFTGVMQPDATPCSVNKDTVIDIPFGNVGVSKVESGIYMQAITYSLDCGSATAANSIEMTLKATPVPGSASTMASSAAGLWVQFYRESKPQDLNTPFKVSDPSAPPKLEVKLVKDPAQDLAEGAFTATATLMAEYQ